MNAPRHPQATKSIYRQLLQGVESFRELERRIAALPTEQERGAAFEVFAEAFLATQPQHQAIEVWPFSTLPSTVKRKLGLGQGQDMGVDGVFEIRANQFHAYQVKFRTDRPSLTWRELSTFAALSDKAAARVLVTNCDDIPEVLNQRAGFYCVRGSDLDRLEARDFDAMVAWMEGAAVHRQKKQPSHTSKKHWMPSCRH
jgi:predicted helicase